MNMVLFSGASLSIVVLSMIVYQYVDSPTFSRIAVARGFDVMKDFLVISDGSTEDELRFDCAGAMASQFNGSINVAVATELPPLLISAGDPSGFLPLDGELRDALLARSSEIKSSVEEHFQKTQHSVSVLQVYDLAEFIGRSVAAIARTHDLCITTLPSGNDDSKLRSLILDGVLIEGGRGLLGLPSGFRSNGSFEHVTIAWNGSRECSRAVSQALPILAKARNVTVVLIDPTLRRAGDEHRPGDSILSHLSRHDVRATLTRATADGMHASEAILAEVSRLGTDLLVMGAQAEGGILQWLQGSTSREVFTTTPIPLLMAH